MVPHHGVKEYSRYKRQRTGKATNKNGHTSCRTMFEMKSMTFAPSQNIMNPAILSFMESSKKQE